MGKEKKPSKSEAIKEESLYLKGLVSEELDDRSSDYVSDASYELLKFHGSYQGYNRDTATERKKAGLEKEWEFMVRMVCPSGFLTPDQYLTLDDIAGKYANGTLRVTTRQTFQFHCIVKENMKAHIKAINDALLTTLGGCGDVVRNVMGATAPIKNVKYQRLLEDSKTIAKFCKPQTTAYHEIWVDGENVASNRNEEEVKIEPLYGKYYMPRKFKIAVAIPEDNTVDALTHDLAFFALYKGEELQGYNVYIGGGLGMTHNKAATYPRLATPVMFIEPENLLKATEAVIKLQRDHGDRSNRKHARLKYVVEENGIDWTLAELEKYYGKFDSPRPMGKIEVVDHMGWHEQGDGKCYLGIPVSSGRIVDREEEKIRTGLREVIKQYQLPIILTADQNVILGDIEADQKESIAQDLRSHGIKLREDISNIYRNTLACVALPTCGKALAEAERVKLPFINEMERLMDKHGISNERLSIRLAGCPNGCSRPYAGDIGIVGRTPDHYAIFVGGDFVGTRLNQKLLDRVPYDKLPDLFDVLFTQYTEGRNDNEGYGDYAYRIGIDAVSNLVKEKFADEKWALK